MRPADFFELSVTVVIVGLFFAFCSGCGAPFESSSGISSASDGGQSQFPSDGWEATQRSVESAPDAGEFRGGDAASVPLPEETSLDSGIEHASPPRDVMNDPWPADVVVVPWPCTNCVPTFSGVMACCELGKPCTSSAGPAAYCADCGCPR